MLVVLSNDEWLFGVGAAVVVWLILLTSIVVSARRKMVRLRTDLNELAEQVKVLMVAEERRLFEQINQPLDSVRKPPRRSRSQSSKGV
jgi:hypothetical protein